METGERSSASKVKGLLAGFVKLGEILSNGDGSAWFLRANLNYEVKEAIQSITPELADHQLALAKIDADKQIRVAELTHLAPMKVAVRPLWISVLLIGGIAAYSLILGFAYLPLTLECVGALALTPILDGLASRIAKVSGQRREL